MPRDPADQPATVMTDAALLLKPVYVRCEGQNDNIGDVVLRRRLLDEFRKSGSLRIFIGKSTADFVDGLQLAPGDAVFTEYEDWRSSLRQSAVAQPTVYLDNAGELQVNWRVALSGLRLLPLLRRVRAGGGCVFRLGVGARSRPGLYGPLFRLAAWFHQMVYWRDPMSRDSFGFGAVMPDWGFADRGPAGPEMAAGPAPVRDRLAVALRSDRPYPGDAWFKGLRRYCLQSGLTPVVVTQVKRDRSRGQQLAKGLGAEFVDWSDESLVAQERKMRGIYRHCAMAISDRLHVLVLAMTEGAVPVCLVDYPESKVGRHFDTIGYGGSSIAATGLTAGAIATELEKAGLRREEAAERLAFAIGEIDRVSEEARRLMGVGKP